MNTFSPTEAIKFGWNTFKKNPVFLIGTYIIIGAIQQVVSMFLSGGSFFKFTTDQTSNAIQSAGGGYLGFVGSGASILISILLSLGLLKAYLNLVNNSKGDFKDIFSEFKNIKLVINYLVASVIVGLIVLGGFILLIIPGIYLVVRLGLFQYYLIEKGMGAMDSIKASWNATKGNVVNLLVFGFFALLVGLVGFAALLVGLIVAIPIITIADIYVYKMLSQQTVDPAPVAPKAPIPQTPSPAMPAI